MGKNGSAGLKERLLKVKGHREAVKSTAPTPLPGPAPLARLRRANPVAQKPGRKGWGRGGAGIGLLGERDDVTAAALLSPNGRRLAAVTGRVRHADDARRTLF